MITLDFTNREPIYEQLQNKITKMALTGALQPNEQLPSVRVFAKELMINPNTVQKAYQFLEQDGVIYSIPGKGNFVSPEIAQNTKFKEESQVRLRETLQMSKVYGLTKADILHVVDQIYGGEAND